jgi:hypothetical protein
MTEERKPPHDVKPEDRWPFDPMQPGDHEPAQLPEALERVQEQKSGESRK